MAFSFAEGADHLWQTRDKIRVDWLLAMGDRVHIVQADELWFIVTRDLIEVSRSVTGRGAIDLAMQRLHPDNPEQVLVTRTTEAANRPD